MMDLLKALDWDLLPMGLWVREEVPAKLGRYRIEVSSGSLYAWGSVDAFELDDEPCELVSVQGECGLYGGRLAAIVRLPAAEDVTVASMSTMIYQGLPAWTMKIVVDGGEVICVNCRRQKHGKCRGGNWCDCQHRVQPEAPKEEVAPDGPVVQSG